MHDRLPYRTAAFLGSFLTFFLELAAAKLLLPRFGGSAYVWTTSVLFFSGLLLAGYAACHFALRRWGWRRFALVHRVLLLAPFAFFPLRLPPPLPGAAPLADLLRALALAAGVPFLVLSCTVIALSARLLRSDRPERGDAYFLFAASNLGALAALAAYPLLIEPFLPLGAQWALWLALYAAYAAPQLLASVPSAAEPAAPAPAAPVSARRRLLWLLLSAAPCAAMLATTNLLTFDFAAVPLLWTAPLAIYLATFVLNFKRRPWYPDRLNSALLPVLGLWAVACLALAALAVLRAGESTPIQTLRRLMDIGKFGYVTAALFVVGMICHKSLAADRPPEEGGMTEYYAWISAGGFLGSLCVAVGVPWLGRRAGALSLDWLAAGALAAASLAVRDWDGLAAFARRRRGLAAGGGAAAFVLAAAAVFAGARGTDGAVFSLRNFYGVYRVVDKGGVREFFHGNTDHGMQSLDPAQAEVPLSYYNRNSPLFDVFDGLGRGWRRVGVVGLGAGTLASYGRPGMAMDFYELDPDVAAIADRWFTYLKGSRSQNRIVVGDARLSLAAAEGAAYDALILDAFNSGAIPIHLVTKEALELYLRRVPGDGVILLHVSNRYLDLRAMLAAMAGELGLAAASKRYVQHGLIADERADRVPSSWVAFARRAETLAPLLGRGWVALKPGSGRGARPWTDRHASLLPVLAL